MSTNILLDSQIKSTFSFVLSKPMYYQKLMFAITAPPGHQLTVTNKIYSQKPSERAKNRRGRNSSEAKKELSLHVKTGC